MAKEIVLVNRGGLTDEALFFYIQGYVEHWADDLPDGAWFAAHEEAVQAFNRDFGTDFDFCDVHTDYFSWLEEEPDDE